MTDVFTMLLNFINLEYRDTVNKATANEVAAKVIQDYKVSQTKITLVSQ